MLYIPDSKDCKLIRHEPSVLTILGLFSKVEQYDDGRYPYQRSTFCEGYYDQDKVSEDILRKFLAVNGTIMKDITHDGKDLYSSCIGGINNSKDATKKLREILGIVVNWKGGRGKARNVYILLDQMDRFFLSSKYYDGDTRIPMPAFTYVQPFVPLITGEIKLESGSVISAIEQPKSTEYDPPMITAINFCECISEYNDREKQRVDLSLCKKFCEDYRIKEGARKIDISEPKTEGILKYPNQYVPDISLFEKMNLKTFHLPMFSEEDINSLFSFYRLASIIPSNYDYTRSFTLKHLLVTGGNGKELFKFITQM